MVNDYYAHLPDKLQHIHPEVLSLVAIEQKAKADAVIASEIEDFLRRIKNLSTEANNPVEAELQKQAEEIVTMATQGMNLGRGKNSQLSSVNQFFNRSHGTKTVFGGDDIFEEEFAAVIAAIEAKAQGASYGSEQGIKMTYDIISGKLVGNQSANIKLEHELSEIAKETITGMMENLGRKIPANAAPPPERMYEKPVARSGKIDVNGTSELEIAANLNPIVERLFTIFKGRTFSLKNYSSYYTKSLNIHLGNTDFFKAIYAVLSSIGYGQDYIEKVIYSGLNRLGWGDTDTGLHFYHMRYVYELTGIGLYDSEGEPISGVDFLIYNDPYTENIFVRSTAQMIFDELNAKPKDVSALGGISISKTSFR